MIGNQAGARGAADAGLAAGAVQHYALDLAMAEGRRHQRMAAFVDGDALRHRGVVIGAESRAQILGHDLAPGAAGLAAQVAQRGVEIGHAVADGLLRQRADLGLRQGQMTAQHARQRDGIGQRHREALVEPARAQHRRIDQIGVVAGRDHDDALVARDPVHQRQKRIHHHDAIVLMRAAIRAGADGVELVEDQHGGGAAAGLGETLAHGLQHIAQMARGLPFAETGRDGGKTRRSCHGLRKPAFAGAGRAVKQHGPGQLVPTEFARAPELQIGDHGAGSAQRRAVAADGVEVGLVILVQFLRRAQGGEIAGDIADRGAAQRDQQIGHAGVKPVHGDMQRGDVPGFTRRMGAGQ